MNEFIEPLSEKINDDDDDIFTTIVDQYSTDKEGTIEELKEGDIEVEVVPTGEALKAIETVRL